MIKFNGNVLLYVCLFFLTLYAVIGIIDNIKFSENKLKSCFMEYPKTKECEYILYRNNLKHGCKCGC